MLESMSKRSRKKRHVFESESEFLDHSEEILGKATELNHETLLREYQLLSEQYARLLGDAKLVTSVSDRLQNKLNNANEQVMEANQKVSAQNEKLRQTISLLREARVGKKATTIVLLLAVLLFLISEAFIEPQIEKVVDDWYIGLLLKGIIAVSLKPLESIVEKYLYKKSMGMEINI